MFLQGNTILACVYYTYIYISIHTCQMTVTRFCCFSLRDDDDHARMKQKKEKKKVGDLDVERRGG